MRARGALGVALATTIVAACSFDNVFACSSDEQCEGTRDGICEPTGYCSFPDAECVSGRRYGALAGGGLAGLCTGVPPPVATDSASATTTTPSSGPSTGTGSGSTSGDAVTDVPSPDAGSSSTSGDPTCGALGQPCCIDACDVGLACISDACELCGARVIADEYQTCAYNNAGRLDCWGRNNEGQLGDGTMEDHAAPATAGVAVASADLGAFHGVAAELVGDGVVGWGGNTDQQLGMMEPGPFLDPIALDDVPSLVALAAGGFHTCGHDGLGTAWCWGNNANGQTAGSAPMLAPPEPVAVAAVDEIAAGGFHSCAVADASVLCWGSNQYLQLGAPLGGGGATPVPVLLPVPVVDVTTGDFHTCALSNAGGVLCWGRDQFGQLGDGDGDAINHAVATVVEGLPTAIDVVAGYDHTCALTGDGDVYCWGRNDENQSSAADLTAFDVPMQVEISDIVSIAAGRDHSCAADTEANVHCWGANTNGQLGVEGPGSASPVLSDFDCAAGPV